jgi:hypothetical protein
MTYACPAWEFAADTDLMKLQRLQNKALRTTGKFPRNIPIHDMHISFQISYIYDYITKLCTQQAHDQGRHQIQSCEAHVIDVQSVRKYEELESCQTDCHQIYRQTTRKGKKANTHTRTRKLTKTQQKNTTENVHSITTCNKGNKSSETDSFRNIKVKHYTHLKMVM